MEPYFSDQELHLVRPTINAAKCLPSQLSLPYDNQLANGSSKRNIDKDPYSTQKVTPLIEIAQWIGNSI